MFSAVESLTASTGAAVQLDVERCLRAHDRQSTCVSCQDLCPANAIRAGSPPALEASACTGCLACLPVCPVGAFAGSDPVTGLLECATRAQASSFELICDRHPQAARGLDRQAVGLRVSGCLAGLGAGAYLALVAQGAQRVVARAEACAACPWASLQPHIAKQVNEAQQLLAAAGRAETVAVQIEPLGAPVERRIQNAQSAPLSRRDLWGQLARQGRDALTHKPSAQTTGALPHRPSPDRRRVIQAMAQLAGQTGSASMTVAPDWSGASWAMLTASAACTACGVCARACPTGALRFDRDASLRFALNFIPRSCVGCEACVHVCFPAALTVDHAPAFQPVFGDPAVYTLAAGELGECPRCHAPMAVRPGETLCSVCAHWQLNPFGSRLPPGRSSPPSSLEQPQ